MNVVEYAQELIRFDSTSFRSNGEVSDYVDSVLGQLGFETERIEHTDAHGVPKSNVIGCFGAGTGGVAYFGHTDVVPSDDWSIAEHGPFEPVLRDGRLYGRGSTDMKGSIACMLAAVESLRGEPFRAPVYLSCTADEEIDHRGAEELIQRSQIYRDLVAGNACGIVGEATSLDVVYAHKGGCQIVVTSHGTASHSSTREGLNANMAMIPFLQEVKAIHDETESDLQWMNDEFNPPTLCVNVGINDHTRAVNITAPQSICTICFRPMPGIDTESLVARLRDAADKHGLDFHLKASNNPFHRDPKTTFVKSCQELSSGNPPRTVGYGSEAGNFTEIERLIVLGPGDIAQAHKSDEFIDLEQLHRGEEAYRKCIQHFCL